VFAYARDCTLPPESTGDSGAPGRNLSCLEHSITTMTLAWGDAGALLAAPGASLARLVIDILGSPEQQQMFYELASDKSAHTFCAITEPAHGSDAAGMESRLERVSDGYVLHGAKRYVGQASRGIAGVVFARTGSSLASIRAVLVTPEMAGIRRDHIATYGLRGAYVGLLELDAVRIEDAAVLGSHLPAMRRGLWGALQAFNIMRVQVASLAVGTCSTVLDYVAEHAPRSPALDPLRAEVAAVRDLVLRGAVQCDADPTVAHLSSLAKLAAVRLALTITEWSTQALGPATIYDHPLMEKWWRDARGFEFMEGVSHVQRTNIATEFERSLR